MKLFRRSILPLGSCRFRPGTVLARSPHSLVIRGHCLQSRQPVILKTIPPEARTPERLEGFERESRHLTAVAAIPGVVQCQLRQPRGPTPAIVFHDPGASAWHLHLQGPRFARLPLPQRLRLLARLAGILHRVHQAGLVHRDVNPANVVWHPGRDLLELIDFSLAGPPRPAPRRAAAPLEGTLAYLAPEQTGRRVVLLVDDLPWTDAPSRRLLEFLLSRQGGHGPFTLLAIWRTGADGEPPERLVSQVMGWRALGLSVECLDLSPLTARAVGELVQSLASRPLSPGPHSARRRQPAPPGHADRTGRPDHP